MNSDNDDVTSSQKVPIMLLQVLRGELNCCKEKKKKSGFINISVLGELCSYKIHMLESTLSTQNATAFGGRVAKVVK